MSPLRNKKGLKPRTKQKKGIVVPTLAEVEAVLGPAYKWAGHCYQIAVACVAKKLVEGVAVYGHWIGRIHSEAFFADRRGLPFTHHGWVHVNGDANCIFDPTRWTFTAEAPFLYLGPNHGEYDEGGNTFKKVVQRPCPLFNADDDEPLMNLDRHVLPTDAWNHVERLLGPDYHEAVVEAGFEIGYITRDQLFWLANTPYNDLQPHAPAIYAAICKLGNEAAIPIDNKRRAEREP